LEVDRHRSLLINPSRSALTAAVEAGESISTPTFSDEMHRNGIFGLKPFPFFGVTLF
jgi:hypothetical protein